MSKSIGRRSLLAMSGLVGASPPWIAAADGPFVDANGTRSNPHMQKQIVTITKDNAVFGASSAAFERYGYSPAVRAAGLLFIAGVVGVRADGTLPESAAEQGELALQRTAEILRLQGLNMADLVDVVSYHVDLNRNLQAFMPIKERYFKRPYPAWSIIGVAALARPEIKIEIRSIAAV
jgi:enamine deaminase RidA (YjgF/YER057c/UK114 family)